MPATSCGNEKKRDGKGWVSRVDGHKVPKGELAKKTGKEKGKKKGKGAGSKVARINH